MGLAAGAGIGAVVGAVGGAISASEQNRIAASNRRRFRRGLRNAEFTTASQVLDISNDPFNVAARNFVGNLFGVDDFSGGAPSTSFRGEEGTNIGGRTFFTDPGRGFNQRTQRQGKRTGRQLARALNRGNDDAAAAALEQFAGNRGQRTGALQALQARGFGLEDINQLDARINPEALAARAPVSAGGSSNLDPLTENIAKGLNQQLSASGFGGGIGDNVAAALGTGIARTQLQLQLLPQLQQFAAQQQLLRGQLLDQNARFEVQRTTGGVGVFGQANPFGQQSVLSGAIQGGLAGLGAGASIGGALSGGGGLAGLGLGQQSTVGQGGFFGGQGVGGLGIDANIPSLSSPAFRPPGQLFSGR